MLDLQRFRKGKDIDMVEKFKSYCKVNKINFESFNSKITKINQLKQKVNKLIYSNNISDLNNQINDCLLYINLLTQINQSIKFGKENKMWELKFRWTNVTTGNSDVSSNLNFEICSVKYNIGICFALIGYKYLYSKNEDELKISKQNFEKAAYIFDELKTMNQYLSDLKVVDFTPEYLSICTNFCLGMAQYYFYLCSECRKLKNAGKSRFITGAYIYLESALSFKFTKLDKTFIKCLSIYFHALGLYFIALDNYIIAEQVKKGLGLVMGYQTYASEIISEISKDDLKKIKDFFNINLIEDLKEQINTFIKKNLKKVNDLYKEVIVDKKNLPKLQYNQFAKKSKYEESAIMQLNEQKERLKIEDSMEKLSLSKIPSNLKGLIEQYKDQLQNELKKEFNRYETSESILKFLSEKNLPYILEPYTDYNPSATPDGEIHVDERIMNVIQYIKDKGGLNYLKSRMNELDEYYNSINETINKFGQSIIKIIEEDKENKILYGDQWVVQSPDDYETRIKNYRKHLIYCKSCDEKIKSEILAKEKYFDVFNLSEEEILLKIPNPLQLVNNLNSSKILKTALNTLNEDEILLNKACNIILSNVSKNIPINELNKVYNKKESMSNIIQNELKKLNSNFNTIEGYSNNIKKDMQIVQEKFSVFEKEISGIKNDGYNKAIAYFSKIYDLFLKYDNSLDERFNSYNEFKNSEIRIFKEDFDGFLFMREMFVVELKENMDYKERVKLSK